MAFIGRPNLQEGMYAKLIDLIGRRPNLLAQGVNELGNVFGAFVGSRYDRERAEQLRQQLAGEKYGADVVGLIEKDRLGPPISRGASDTIPTAVGGISLADLQAIMRDVSPAKSREDIYKSMVGTMGPTTMDLAKARGYKGDIGEARKILPAEPKGNLMEVTADMVKVAPELAAIMAQGKKISPSTWTGIVRVREARNLYFGKSATDDFNKAVKLAFPDVETDMALRTGDMEVIKEKLAEAMKVVKEIKSGKKEPEKKKRKSLDELGKGIL